MVKRRGRASICSAKRSPAFNSNKIIRFVPLHWRRALWLLFCANARRMRLQNGGTVSDDRNSPQYARRSQTGERSPFCAPSSSRPTRKDVVRNMGEKFAASNVIDRGSTSVSISTSPGLSPPPLSVGRLIKTNLRISMPANRMSRCFSAPRHPVSVLINIHGRRKRRPSTRLTAIRFSAVRAMTTEATLTWLD